MRLCLNAAETQLFNYSTDAIPVVTLRVRASGMLENSPPNFMEGKNQAIEQRLEQEFR